MALGVTGGVGSGVVTRVEASGALGDGGGVILGDSGGDGAVGKAGVASAPGVAGGVDGGVAGGSGDAVRCVGGKQAREEVGVPLLLQPPPCSKGGANTGRSTSFSNREC